MQLLLVFMMIIGNAQWRLLLLCFALYSEPMADKSYIKFGQEYITAQLQNTVGFLDNNIRQLSYFELKKI